MEPTNRKTPRIRHWNITSFLPFALVQFHQFKVAIPSIHPSWKKELCLEGKKPRRFSRVFPYQLRSLRRDFRNTKRIDGTIVYIYLHENHYQAFRYSNCRNIYIVHGLYPNHQGIKISTTHHPVFVWIWNISIHIPCWWLKSGVHKLRLVAYPTICKVS